MMADFSSVQGASSSCMPSVPSDSSSLVLLALLLSLSPPATDDARLELVEDAELSGMSPHSSHGLFSI
jgi:hypothetical protein